MVNVKVLELSRGRELRVIEKRINEDLKRHGLKDASVALFRTDDGEIGYSARVAHVLPASGSRKALEVIHRVVCRAIGYKRGRPPGEPSHQVKCRVPEGVYQRLVRAAKKRDVTPSSLLAELAEQELAQ
jgi:hypothetical protein